MDAPRDALNAARHYVADMTGGSLLLADGKAVAGTLLGDHTDLEWKQLIAEKNVLQKRSSHTALRYARTLRRRLEPLGHDFIKVLRTASEPEYVQMMMLATILHAPVVEDFMNEVVAEHRRVYKSCLERDSWESFFEAKQRAIRGLTQLSNSTSRKTGLNTVRCLVEAGYLDNTRQQCLQPVYLLPSVKVWLMRFQREDLEKVMECTV